MRKILFRGKRVDNGEWVEGLLFTYNGNHCIQLEGIGCDDYGLYPRCYAEIITESISEFTSLTDKNGKKIFEGDIVKREYTLHHGETKTTRETQIGVVNFNDRGEFIANTVKGRGNWFSIGVVWKGDYIEVIGNIYDNPELLKGE